MKFSKAVVDDLYKSKATPGLSMDSNGLVSKLNDSIYYFTVLPLTASKLQAISFASLTSRLQNQLVTSHAWMLIVSEA